MLAKRMRGLLGRAAPGPAAPRRAGAALFTLAVLGCLVLLNVLAARHHRRWDLTAARVNSLAPETLQVLAGLRQDVSVIAFPEPGSGLQDYLAGLLQEYRAGAGGHLSFRFVDPEAEPALVQQYGVTSYDTVVLATGRRQVRIDGYDLSAPPGPDGEPRYSAESALTAALVRLAQQRQRKVYFLQGHEERDLATELGEVSRRLTAGGYAALPLDLVQQPAVPPDADVLVIAGPRQDLSGPESEAIQHWADDGGRVLLMAGPSAAAQPNLMALATALGVRLDADQVVDPASHYRFDTAALVPTYAGHAITDRTEASQMRMLLPGARSLILAGGRGWQATPLLETSAQAAGRPEPASAPGAAPAAAPAARPGGYRGPLTLAAALERGEGKERQRAVVVGSAAFATDTAVRLTPANLDFVSASLAWLTESSGVAIPPRADAPARIFLTGRQANLVLFSSAVALPLAVLLVGGLVWLRRRHL